MYAGFSTNFQAPIAGGFWQAIALSGQDAMVGAVSGGPSDTGAVYVYSFHCRDGVDNDANGATDYPADTSCSDPFDNAEYQLKPGDVITADYGTGDNGGTGGLVRIDPVTGAQISLYRGFPLIDPIDVEVDANGDIFVSDTNSNGALHKLDTNTGELLPIAWGDPIGFGRYIALEADGHVLMCDWSANVPLRIDPNTGDVTRVADHLLAGYGPCEGVDVAANGAILTSDRQLDRLVSYDPVREDPLIMTPGDCCDAPLDVAFLDNEEALVVERATDSIYQVVINGSSRQLVSSGQLLAGQKPAGIALETDGKILVMSTQGKLVRIDPLAASDANQTEVSSGGLLEQPVGISVVTQVPEPGVSNLGLAALSALALIARVRGRGDR
jgi:streptogramin lyase